MAVVELLGQVGLEHLGVAASTRPSEAALSPTSVHASNAHSACWSICVKKRAPISGMRSFTDLLCPRYGAEIRYLWLGFFLVKQHQWGKAKWAYWMRLSRSFE